MLTKGKRTREHIIATAAPIFNSKGFAGTSMADILLATGLEKGGIYRHFAGKDELACAAFDHAVSILESRHHAAQIGAATASQRLHACVDVVAKSVLAPPLPGGCPILNTAVEADDTHRDLSAKAAAAMRNWQERIVRIVADGVAAGELAVPLDGDAVAALITASLEGAIMITSLLHDPSQMARVAAHLHAYVESLQRQPSRVTEAGSRDQAEGSTRVRRSAPAPGGSRAPKKGST